MLVKERTGVSVFHRAVLLWFPPGAQCPGVLRQPVQSGNSALVVSACGLRGQIRLQGRHNQEVIILSRILNAISYLKVLNRVFCNKTFRV